MVGDLLDIELQATLSTTSTATTLVNAGAGYVTHINAIILTLQAGSTTERKVTIYKNGSAAANEIINLDLDPTGEKSVIITDSRIKLTGTQMLYLKQGVGADVNVVIQATREQVA